METPAEYSRKKTSIIYAVVYLIVIIVSVIVFSLCSNKIIQTCSILLASVLCTLTIIIVLTLLFGSLTSSYGFFDFIIGDQGTFSLSRIQAFLWAIVITSSQLQTVLVLLLNSSGGNFFYYEPVFSESSLWLLALSMGSYIAVKGITVDQIQKQPALYKRHTTPQWKDVLMGANGLDFSKCQMLLWTVIALLVYISKCYYFTHGLIDASATSVIEMFSNVYNEYGNARKLPDPSLPYVPYLSWSFVVLMGLSQGTYIGKKLVPKFKEGEAKAQQRNEILDSIARIDIEIKAKQTLLANLNPVSAIGIENKLQLERSLQDLIYQRMIHQSQLSNN